eukprot:SAG11_NODE_2085_length_3847_cov_2.866329_1_plen_63_part_00
MPVAGSSFVAAVVGAFTALSELPRFPMMADNGPDKPGRATRGVVVSGLESAIEIVVVITPRS